MKRVYQSVSVEPVEGGFEIRLDGRPVRTPDRSALVVLSRALADAIRTEWGAQETEVRPATMPLTQLACTAIDRTGPQKAAFVDGVLAYAGTDLLCYRADRPPALVARQVEIWQPLLDWLALRHDALLHVAAGIIAVEQPPETLAALRKAVGALDAWQLAGVQNAVAVSGSLVVALALLEGEVDAAGAFAAAELDETFQIERWGEDAEAAQRRRALQEDLAATERFLRLLKQ